MSVASLRGGPASTPTSNLGQGMTRMTSESLVLLPHPQLSRLWAPQWIDSHHHSGPVRTLPPKPSIMSATGW